MGAAEWGVVLVAGLGMVCGSARADEPLFGFVYTTDLLPKDQKEVEQWLTWRTQKAHGYYDQLENRTEFSYGVSDSFQLSGYLNYNWTHAYRNAVDRTTAPPEQFADFPAGPDEKFNAARFVGVSIEALYRIMSPYTDPVGLAVYLEPTVGTNFREIETRIILQKNFFDDRLVIAANLTIAPELRQHVPPPKNETDVNWSVGVSYRFAPSWSFGWEFQNEREDNDLGIVAVGKWTNDAYYTGPTLHYGGERFFATLTVWEQLPFAKNYCSNCDVLYQGRDYDVDFEKYRTRLKLGYYF